MEADIKDRIYRCINPYSVPMMEFLKLTKIEYSTETKTACVTCEEYPKLLLNKDFIDTYCETDEHLFMLIMHELYHIVLGHTKLFKRVDTIDNIVFDAVINSILIRTFNDESYTSFFESINDSKTFPSCILRPKSKDTPKEYIEILDSLYETNKGTYQELYELLINKIKDLNLDIYLLVGNHNNFTYSNEFNDIYKRIVDGWPREEVIEGRDVFGDLVVSKYDEENLFLKRKKEIINFLKKEGLVGGAKETKGYGLNKYEKISVIPSLKDRTTFTKKLFYPQLLYKNESLKYCNDYSLSKAFVYLDVSGSVEEFVPSILTVLDNAVKRKICEIYAFSTIVSKLTLKNFIDKTYETTYGTDINCCFEHFFKEKRNVKRIVLITDGYTGEAYSKYLNKLKNIRIDCMLIGEDNSKDYLKNIVKEFKEIL